MNDIYQIALPFSPALPLGTKIKKGYKIHLTFGGGMGGGRREIFTYNKVDTTNSFVKIKDIFGVEREINLLHTVSIDPIQIVKFAVKNTGNQYVSCPIGKTQANYYYFDPTDKVEFITNDISRSRDSDDLNYHLISTIIK